MKIKFKHEFKKEANLLKKLKRDLKKTALTGLDRAISSSVGDLKSKLRQELRTVEQRSQGQIGRQTTPNPDKPRMPKYKSDLIKHIFGKNYEDLELAKQPTKSNWPTKFGSGFYMTMNGRFEVNVPMQHGLSANDYKNMVKNSFKDAIFIDPETGEAYQLDPNFADGLKLKCSHKGRSDDERLDAAINNGQTEITVSAYKDNFKRSMDKAIPIGPIADSILEGNYNQAKEVLQRYGETEVAQEAINKVEELKNDDTENIAPDVVALNNTVKLIKNVRIKKVIKKDTKVEYLLVSNYQSDGEQFEALYDELQSQISFWLVGVQDSLVQAITQEVTKIIEQYGRAR